MKIYIGYDYDQNPIGVILADTQDRAEIVWAAMKDMPHSVEELDPSKAEGIHGVVFLLTSEEISITIPSINDRIRTIRKFKRGL